MRAPPVETAESAGEASRPAGRSTVETHIIGRMTHRRERLRAAPRICSRAHADRCRRETMGQNRHDVGRRSRTPGRTVHQRRRSQRAAAGVNLHAPEFVRARHRHTASLRLMISLASAARSKVQRLSGAAKASVALACCSSSKYRWPTVRRCVFMPPTSMPTASPAPGARLLLAHSRLGVLLVGELRRTR